MSSYYPNLRSIQKIDGKFQISSTTNTSFKSLVLIDGSTKGFDERLNRYKSVSNNVDFYWGYNEKEVDSFVISYNSVSIIEISQPSIQVVLEYLNKFCALPAEDVEKAVIKAQEITKTTLQEEIESLIAQKVALEEKVKIYLEIEKKRKELNDLVEKLENK
jgi:hypothetical protein